MAVNCSGQIAADIILDCESKPIAGLEYEILLLNRNDINIATISGTNKCLVTALTMKSTKKAWSYQGFKKTANAGTDLVVADNMPDSFAHFLSLVIWGSNAASVEALKDLNDVVAIVENKNKGVAGDGAFEIYGLETGLFKSSLTKRSNDNGGIYSVELKSNSGEEASVPCHVFFVTDYATTKAAFTALKTAAI